MQSLASNWFDRFPSFSSLCQPVKSEFIDKILAVMPILDAFGNASTELNSHATRHLRIVEIFISRSGTVSGMTVTMDMLESLRIMNTPK